MSSRNGFPVAEAIGRKYCTEQNGVGFEGVITDAFVRGECVVLLEGEKEAFVFDRQWGSWWEDNGVIWVSIPYIGTYTLRELVS